MMVKRILPLLASLFTFAFWASAMKFSAPLFSGFSPPPWLWILLLAGSLESSYFAAFFLTPRTPYLVRLLELVLLFVPLYLFYGAFKLDLLYPALLVFMAWLTARSYGSQFVTMEKVADTLGDQGASTVKWEYESLTSKNAYGSIPMEYFWWRLFSFAFVLVVLAIVTRVQGASFELGFLGLLFVVSGLMLQGCVYLFRLQMLWGFARAEVDKGLPRLWLRHLGLFVLLAALLVSLAPVNYSPLTAARLGSIVAGLWGGAVDFSLPQIPSQEPVPPAQEGLDFVVEEGEPGLAGILVALLFLLFFSLVGLVLIFSLGLFVLALAKGEVERLRGLPNLLVRMYLTLRKVFVSALKRLGLSGLASLFPDERSSEIFTRLAERQQEPLGKPGREDKPTGVRAMLRRIINRASKKGLIYQPSQTALEYGEVLEGRLATNKATVEEFFRGYQEVRYSFQKLSKVEEERLLAAGSVILAQIEALEKGDSSND